MSICAEQIISIKNKKENKVVNKKQIVNKNKKSEE